MATWMREVTWIVTSPSPPHEPLQGVIFEELDHTDTHVLAKIGRSHIWFTRDEVKNHTTGIRRRKEKAAV